MEGGLGGGAIKLASAYVDLRAPTGQLGRDYATARAQTQSFATSTTAAIAQAERANARATKAIGAQWATAGAKTQAAARHLKAPAAAAALVSVAVGKLSIDFDREMRNVNSIAQLPEAQLDKLSKKVLGLAGPTAQAPKTLAAGLYDLVSSGFNASQSMTVLQASAKAATAGLTTTEVSTKAVAAVLNAYRLPASKAKAVSDTLFRTVDRGVITFESLAQNVGDVLPFASSLQVNLREVGGAIATMTKAGISAPETMTRIKAVMVSMLKPGKDLKATVKDLGYESAEAMIQQLGFLGSLRALSKEVHGNKSALAGLFPNIRAMGGALALTGGNAKAAAADLRGMRKDSGATAKALSQQSQSISYQWNKTKAEAEAVGIAVGSKLLPALGDLLHVGVGLISLFGNLPAPLQDLILYGGLAVTALYPLVLIGGKMMSAWGGFLGLIDKVELSLMGQAGAATRAAAANAELAASTAAAAAAQKELLIANSSGTVVGSVPIGGPPVARTPTISKYVNRAGTGMMIGMAGMAAGGAIGGSVGNMVSGMGAGDGAGMMFGVPGAIVGGLAGGAAANVKTLIEQVQAANHVKTAQEKLADSSKGVAAWMHKERQAVAGVKAASQGLAQAHHRADASSDRVKQAEQRLTHVRQKFGPTSRQALHAEYELAQIRQRNRQRSDQLADAEKRHGTSLQQYKAVARSTVAEERHRIHGLKEESDRLADLFHHEEKHGASQARLAELGRRGLKVTDDLRKAHKNYSNTLKEAAQVGGEKFAKSLKNSDTQTLRFWNTIKHTGPKLAELGNNPAPKKLASAFDDMDRRVSRIMANQRRMLQRTGTAYKNASSAGVGGLGELAGATNSFMQNFGGPKVNFSVGAGGKGGAPAGPRGPIGAHAQGGKVTRPIAVMGEEAPRHHEWVVATNPAYRQRNLSYWAAAGRDLGVPGFAAGGKHGGTGGLPHPHVAGQEPLRSVAQGPIDKAYTIATAYLQQMKARSGGGIPSFSGDWVKVMAQIAKAKHWDLGDWKWIVGHESGGRVSAKNPTSTAFGLGQLLDSTYAVYGGGPGSSGAEQIEAMARYIADRYGTPSRARSFWEAHNYYAQGGLIGGRPGSSLSWSGVGSSGLQSGIRNMAAYVMGKYPGLSVTSTTGGEHADGSYHYKGQAVDLAGTGMTAAAGWINASLASALTEGIHNPNLSVKNGSHVSSSSWGAETWADHVDHIHLAVDHPWSASDAGSGASAENVPAVFHGAKTKKLSFGEIPKTLHGVKKEIGRRQAELHHYRAAKAKAEGMPKIQRAIAANVTALENRLKQLFRARALLRRKAAQKKVQRRLGRELGKLTGYEGQIASKQRAYEIASQTAEQLVGLEPLPEELPSTATDAQREAAEKAYAKRFEEYVETKERPAFESVLGLAGDWRNKIIEGEHKATGQEVGWEKQIRRTEGEINSVNAYTKKVAQDVSTWKAKHKGAAYPDWLLKEIKKDHEQRAQLPVLRFRERELRKTLGAGRGLFYPGFKNPVSPPHPPLPGTGSFEEMLIGVQGIHWPDQHNLIKSLPAGRVAGQFGGEIWDVQEAIEGLSLKIKSAQASIGGGGGGGGGDDLNAERNELLEELARSGLRNAAIDESQREALKGWDELRQGIRRSFAGMFAGGGHIPRGMFGIVGERGPEIFHGPGDIVGASKSARILSGDSSPTVQVTVNGDIVQKAGDTRDPVEVTVDGVLQSTGTGRRHPGAFATRP